MADTTSFHVNGPALLLIGEQGVPNATKQLGISEDGVDIVLTKHDEPIMTDAAGSRIPHDVQDMGEDAMITFRLVKYDLDVLQLLRQKRDVKEGQGFTRGRPIFANRLGFSLVIVSQFDESWRFFSCTLRGPKRAKVGTRRTAWDCGVYAIPQEIPALGGGWFLYDHKINAALLR